MKVLLLSDMASEHTEKWALGLAGKGIKVGLFSFNRAAYEWYNHENITVFFEPEKAIDAERKLTKLAYLRHVGVLKSILKHFKPDILHAHYATSYGFVGALSGFHPFVISSWGTDVMKFPQKNFIAKSILRYNFKSADLLCATSATIEKYILEIIDKEVKVIPFGVDTDVFAPEKVDSVFGDDCFVFGSIKPLEPLYNVDVLIKSFAGIASTYKHARLMIIGEGSMLEDLKKMAKDLDIEEKVKFTGRIPFTEISKYFNMLDVLANLSDYESFGVSVIEAMACEKPVIVTDVGGLAEIVSSDAVGLKVPVKDEQGTMAAMEKFILNRELCKTTGRNAREHVIKKYTCGGNGNLPHI